MQYPGSSYSQPIRYRDLESRMKHEKSRQPGIAFPAPRYQENALIIRLDIISEDRSKAYEGIKRLCSLFEQIDNGIIEIEDHNSEGELVRQKLSNYNFTATIGFGKTFFERWNLIDNCPENLYNMPDHSELGDSSSYKLPQTDIIIQILSSKYSLNAMLLQNDWFLHYSRDISPVYYKQENNTSDIITTIDGWAKITDVHTGFHRTDGRNLMGFQDGISNPDRLINDSVWISSDENNGRFRNGTFMIFQKIEHDLEEWHKLSTKAQEEWVGRSKATGLLLGTLSDEEEKKIIADLDYGDPLKRTNGVIKLGKLIDDQRNPIKNFFNPYDTRTWKIDRRCPVTSHVRRANDRQQKDKAKNLIFRRGYVYMQNEYTGIPKSGLLFISFQRDTKLFERIKKNIAHNQNPVNFAGKSSYTQKHSGTSESFKNLFNTQTLGGGYYFVPPIPDRKISGIPEQLFQ